MGGNTGKDKFYLKLVEASSPITKSPATSFRLAVLGLKEVAACYIPEGTVSQDLGESNASTSPIFPRPDRPECTTELDLSEGEMLSGKVGKPIEIPLILGDNSDIFTGVTLDPSEEDFTIEESADKIYLIGKREGEFFIELQIQYNGCTSCQLLVAVVIEARGTGEEPGLIDEGQVENEDRDCEDIFDEGKKEYYEALDTYVWQKDANSTMNVDNNIKVKYGQSATLQGQDFWTGLEYIYTTHWIVDERGTVSSDVPKMIYGYSENQKTIEDVIQGFVKTDITESWEDFHNTAYSSYGLTDCASTVDKASLWATSQLKVPFIIDDDSKWLTESPILETIIQKFKEIHLHKIITLARARDVIADSAHTIAGAYVSDILPLREHLGFLNLEPQLGSYKYDESDIFFPMDYRSNGSEWHNVVYTPNAEYEDYHYSGNYSAKEEKALIAGAVAIHELAHALDNRYYDFKGVLLTEEPGWLSLSGWGSKDANGDYTPLRKTSFGNTGNKKFPATPYGCSSPSEDFAEAYAMYKYNPKFLCYYHKEKFCYIKQKEEELFAMLGETATPPSHDCGC